MRSPIRTFSRFMTSTALSLVAIVTILLGYSFLNAEYENYAALAQEQAVLEKAKASLAEARGKYAEKLPDRIPKPKSPLNLLAERIKSLEAEISVKRAERQKLWDAHPLERMLPTSKTFHEIAILDMQIAFLQQALVHVRNLHTFGTVPLEAERQIKWYQDGSKRLANDLNANEWAQYNLAQREPLLWRVPFTPAYREMKRLEAEQRSLQSAKAQHDTEVARWQAKLDVLRKLPRPGNFVLDTSAADSAIRVINDQFKGNEKQLAGSNLHKFMRPVIELLPTALWILGLALLSPVLIKGIAYYVIAPIAVRRSELQLLPNTSGIIRTSIDASLSESGPTVPSRVSLPLRLDAGSELLILPSYLQGMPVNARSDTKWLLDWSMPLTCLIAGMYRLTRIRPGNEEYVTVSSSTDPLAEFTLLDVPKGSAVMLQPRCLLGLIQDHDKPPRITRHWRFGSLGAWLTLQLRYIVFHGPAKLIVKGCRGVRVEPAINGRTVNQAATLGFSANLTYSVARNEVFWSYYFGERELFNDSWRGQGACVYAETTDPSKRSGLFGRGLQGILDTILKIFGI